MKNKINFNNFRNVVIIAIIIEILIMASISYFDSSPCHAEEYSLKWLQSVQLLLVSFFAYKNFGINKGKIKVFWILACLAFLFAGIDELFMIHERIGNLLANTAIDNLYPYLLDSFVLVVYFFVGIIFLLYFYKSFYTRYKNHSWLYIFVLALIINAYSVFADVVSWGCSEEYAEAFASLFYFLAFLLAYKTNRKTAKSELKNDEN